MARDDEGGLSIGELKECLYALTDLGGAWGRNMGTEKKVLVRVHGHLFDLGTVSASFVDGRVVVILDGSTAVTTLLLPVIKKACIVSPARDERAGGPDEQDFHPG